MATILQIFVVRDRASDQFGNPMFLVSSGQAHRSFSDEINREASDNQLFRHPDDFDLYSLGSYDTGTGIFSCHPPKMVAVGKELVLKK